MESLGRVLRWYFALGFAYGLWALVFLQFRECGLFGGAGCRLTVDLSGETVLRVATVLPPVVVYSVVLAFTRALVWLPNLVFAIGEGKFLDWLLLRDVPPMNDFFLLFAQILP